MPIRVAAGSLCVSPICGPRSGVPTAFIALPKTRFRPSLVASPIRAAAAKAEADEGDLTGEWPVNWSLASYEDVGEFFQNSLFKDSASPGNSLKDIMSTDLTVVYPDTKIEDLGAIFSKVTGVPVVKSESDLTLVGVLSKKDLSKSGKVVRDICSSPPVAARPENKVADAACLMLKHKVHRIPIVDQQAKLIGIVTRTDIFTALGHEASPGIV
jgi:CBS domain-containing protein